MATLQCPLLFPSLKEMLGTLEEFVEKHESQAEQYGICKITAPKGWTACRAGYNGQDSDLRIGRTKQEITLDQNIEGYYKAVMHPLRKQKVAVFKKKSEEGYGRLRTAPPEPSDHEPSNKLEAAYWKYVAGSVEYGADNEGSLFDSDVKVSQLSLTGSSGNGLSGVSVMQ